MKDDAEYEEQRRQYRAAILRQQLIFLRAVSRTLPGRAVAGSVALFIAVLVLVRLGILTSGSAADWLAAGGAIFAAVIALNIATRDRRERAAERHQADFAQMRLVQVSVKHYADSSTPSYNLRVTVTNHGSRPILDAQIQSADLRAGFGHVDAPVYRLADPPPQPPVIEVIPHVEQQLLLRQTTYEQCQFIITVADDNGHPYWHRTELNPFIRVEIACTDADGTFWLISNNHEPQQPTLDPGPPPLQVIWTERRQIVDQLWLYFKPSPSTRRVLLRAVIAFVTTFAIAGVARWLGLINIEALLR